MITRFALGLFLSLSIISCGTAGTTSSSSAPSIDFTVDLNQRANDKFVVEIAVDNLTKMQHTFNFASTAPGTYQVNDIGRFVEEFKAYDEKGTLIPTSKVGTNQYKLSTPSKIKKITYLVKETWDTPVTENHLYEMCGTSIEKDHVLINGQAVWGFFSGLQSTPFSIKLLYPKEWKIGTALKKQANGTYRAKSYDHAVDSPILLGRLTKASTKVRNTDVEIYTYSKTDKISSEQIMSSMQDMLNSADAFINGLPVDRYTFLFHFEDKSVGAWEHSYSSSYIYKEDDWEKVKGSVQDVAAHEFFHIVTPLNLHSEIIHTFNFEKPQASRHLWLYEGITEWASHKMLLESGVKSLEDYLKNLQRKVTIDQKYYGKISLEQLSLTSFTKEGQREYGNIYMKGALVAGLLDLKLLELTNGKKDLMNVINELTAMYGPTKPFDDATFFDTFVKATHPGIKPFVEQFIRDTVVLPLTELYKTVGVEYLALDTTSATVELPFAPGLKGDQLMVSMAKDPNLKVGDIIETIDNQPLNMSTVQAVLGKLMAEPKAVPFEIGIKRGEEVINIQTTTKAVPKPNVFKEVKELTEAQTQRRKIWLGKK